MDAFITNLVALFSSTFTTTFKSYNYGRVDIPGQQAMPMISVHPVRTALSNSGTVKDKNLFTVRVRVSANVKQFFDNTNGEGSTIDAIQQLVKWVEDRDSNGKLITASILAVIRQNITASGAVLYNDDINVEYDDYFVDNEFPEVKADITFTGELRSDRV